MELKKSTDDIFSNTTKDAFLLVPSAAFPLKYRSLIVCLTTHEKLNEKTGL